MSPVSIVCMHSFIDGLAISSYSVLVPEAQDGLVRSRSFPETEDVLLDESGGSLCELRKAEGRRYGVRRLRSGPSFPFLLNRF